MAQTRRSLAAAASALAVAFIPAASSAVGPVEGASQRREVSNQDDKLIALYSRAISADQRSNDLIQPYYAMDFNAPEYEGFDAALDEAQRIVIAEYHPALKEAARLQVTNLDGLRAKARLLILQLDSTDEDAELAISLARDILAGRA